MSDSVQRDDVELIAGRNTVLESLRDGALVEKVFIMFGVRGDFEKEIRYLCKQSNVHLVTLPRERMQRMYSGNHQGVLAWISPIRYHDLDTILGLTYESGEIPLIVFLDRVTDVRNFGAIARSAEVLGAHAICISKKGSAQMSAEAIKSSAGALLKIPVCRAPNLLNAIQTARQHGLNVLAAEMNGSIELEATDLAKPTVILMGSEGKGLSRELLELADERVSIPQIGSVESLNVSVACGIILYEAMCQRKQAN